MRRLALLLVLLVGCEVDETVVDPVCDPGHEAWVRQVVPLLWGRHPRSVHEVAILAEQAEALGRADLVRAMANSDEYRVAWRDRLYDILRVDRSGLRTNPPCFEARRIAEPTADLATHVRDFGPADAPFADEWSFHDLTDSALILDDLSVLHRALLFAMLTRDKVPVNEEEAQAVTLDYLQLFERVWLGRDLDCMPCHNGEYSTTNHDDPELDRTWEIPGLFELAVFGANAGRPKLEVAVHFRRVGVVDGAGYVWGLPSDVPEGIGVAPWGTTSFCGAFLRPEDVVPDYFGTEGYFVDPAGPTASPWQLEEHLREGFEVLRRDGLVLDEDLTTGGPEAFAWLVAMNTAESIWRAAVSRPLTVAHRFPRNRAQRDLLDRMARRWVETDYSLVELLVTATTEPAFSFGLPATCGTVDAPWTMDPLLDPWTVDRAEGPRDNVLGDRIVRQDVRTLVRSMTGAMGWGEPPRFVPAASDPAGLELTSLGVFLKDSVPGFAGPDFQGTLAWEDLFGGCVDPEWTPADGPDWIDSLLAEQPGADGWALAAAVKDRILADPRIDDEEKELLTAVGDVTAADPEPALRALCGLWAMSPDFQLAGYPRSGAIETTPAVSGPGSSRAAVCAALQDALQRSDLCP